MQTVFIIQKFWTPFVRVHISQKTDETISGNNIWTKDLLLESKKSIEQKLALPENVRLAEQSC